MTHLVKILKLYQLVEEEEAGKSSLNFLSADPSLSLSSSPDQESKDKRSRSEHYKEDGRPQNLDESKEILDKHDQKN